MIKEIELNPVKKNISIALFLLLLTLPHSSSNSYADTSSASPQPASDSNCSSVCAGVQGQIKNYCAASNDSQCTHEAQARWNVLSPKCAEWKLDSSAKTGDLATAIAYTAAAAVCWGACGAIFLAGAGEAAAGACTFAGAGAEVISLTADINLLVEGQPFALAADGLGLAGTGAAAIATQAKSRNSPAQKATCLAAGIFTASAALKWINYKRNQNAAQNACQDIKSMAGSGIGVSEGSGTGVLEKIPGSHTSDPQGVAAQSLSNSNTASAANNSNVESGAELSGTTDDISSITAGNDTQFPVGNMSAASAGPMGNLLNALPNRSQIPRALVNMGTSLNNLGNALVSGSNPASALQNALPNLPSRTLAAIHKIQNWADEGKLQMQGSQVSMMTSGGGLNGKKTQSSNPLSFMPFKSGNTLNANNSKETGFGHEENQLESTGTDIWHSTWNGSIFQIVSSRLEMKIRSWKQN